MKRWDPSYNYQRQPCAPLEGGGVADVLTCARNVSAYFFAFFICTQPKISLELNNNNKQTIMKL